tara:strand:- start:399 stop:629 length:231 start_codon:yes stop_codon:yes gene_type:complete
MLRAVLSIEVDYSDADKDDMEDVEAQLQEAASCLANRGHFTSGLDLTVTSFRTTVTTEVVEATQEAFNFAKEGKRG